MYVVRSKLTERNQKVRFRQISELCGSKRADGVFFLLFALLLLPPRIVFDMVVGGVSRI
jgi:hypothetical protein